jgi:hypothetical protein
MSNPWRPFDAPQVSALAASARRNNGLGERVCPACGLRCVRSYRHASLRSTGRTAISYVWCSSCHRYAGSTGPLSATSDILDPLSSEDHSVLDGDLAALLKRLDELWDQGILPPEINYRRRPLAQANRAGSRSDTRRCVDAVRALVQRDGGFGALCSHPQYRRTHAGGFSRPVGRARMGREP